ncbi:hypothetical protein [Marinicella sp. W31]|uniref:hypothetical protein n=1 Tax=Marinicella sp. W31 TaxID=3023713 RepID=UPI003756B441
MLINFHFIKTIFHNTVFGLKSYGIFYLYYSVIFTATNSGLLYAIDRTDITLHFAHYIGYVFVFLMLNTKLMVMIHQTELLQQKPRISALIKWTRHETIFLLWLISFAILCFLFTYLISFVAYPVVAFFYYNAPVIIENTFAFVLVMVMAYMPVRCILALPAAATGQRYAFSHSWQDTQYMGIELLILLLLLPIAALILLHVWSFNHGFQYIINGFILTALIIIETTLLSHVFQTLRPPKD